MFMLMFMLMFMQVPGNVGTDADNSCSEEQEVLGR